MEVRYWEVSGTPQTKSYWEINDGGYNSGTVNNNAPETFRITREGTYLKTYAYYNSQWNLLDSVDLGAYASEINMLDVVLQDQSNYGATVLLDDLDIVDGCPTGSSVVWTTTTTSMTTTTKTEPPA